MSLTMRIRRWLATVLRLSPGNPTLRSAPDEKSPPSPAITMIRCCEFSNSAKAAASNSHPSGGIALRVSGRRNVRYLTEPRSSIENKGLDVAHLRETSYWPAAPRDVRHCG